MGAKEYKRIENRKQNYMLKVFDILNKAGYDYVTAQYRTHLFIKKHQIPTVPLTWLLLDPCYFDGWKLEIQVFFCEMKLIGRGQFLKSL